MLSNKVRLAKAGSLSRASAIFAKFKFMSGQKSGKGQRV